jgi:NAD(P)-dependent dehydrogenase (short-subunit alcohol dehydrogenase family)
MTLRGKVALVVGSTSGIGRATARRFAADGAQVVVSGRKRDRGDAVVAEITAMGHEAAFVQIDAGVEREVEQGVGAVLDLYGRLDSIVFAAAAQDAKFGDGEMRDRAVVDLAAAALENIFRVGVFGAFWTCKYAIPRMLRSGGGSIIMISSLSAVEGKPNAPAYAASKGALDALTRQLAVDYGKQNIRANALNVGFVLGENNTAMGAGNPELVAAFLDVIPYVRGGTPEDVAAVAAFLSSDDAAYINGVCLPVDGGRRIRSSAPDFSQVIKVNE